LIDCYKNKKSDCEVGLLGIVIFYINIITINSRPDFYG